MAPSKSYRIVDWPDRHAVFHDDDPFFTETSIQLLSMGRIVIYDRLHAAILAFLAEIPFVYINPSTGKISKCLRVAMDFCNPTAKDELGFDHGHNLTDAIAKASKLLQSASF